MEFEESDAELAELLDKLARRMAARAAEARSGGEDGGLLEVLESREAFEEFTSAPGAAVVVFTSPACPGCVMYKPFVEEAAKLLKGVVRFAELNVYAVPEAAWELGVMGTPSTVVFIDGKPVAGVAGPMDVEGIVELVARAAEEAGRSDLATAVRSKLRGRQ